MKSYTPQSVTEAVLMQMQSTGDERLKTIMESAIRHLHAFAREVNLTPVEWLQAIEFLTRVGKTCTATRQEFILLSDVVGLSTLVNTLHDATAVEEATSTSLLGPFFREDAPPLPIGEQMSKRDKSEEILLWGSVRNAAGEAIPDAKLMVWQTSSSGVYDLQEGDGSAIDYRGTFRADAGGNYHLRTVRPFGYFIPMDGPVGELVLAQGREGCRPAHIHFLISAAGYRELVTALYFPDRYLETDVVFGASPELVVSEKAQDPQAPVKGLSSVRFDFTLARAGSRDSGGGRVGADPAKLGA
ncbi:MAG TPA: dioxygenase [Steroidobacteraceae bacterium]|jgi:catechol 1,2-dioxygenase/hydroxyquinol 1,2-dioxygenase|nr:dioxygenase [Steroidobacteraceae bacterium]